MTLILHVAEETAAAASVSYVVLHYNLLYVGHALSSSKEGFSLFVPVTVLSFHISSVRYEIVTLHYFDERLNKLWIHNQVVKCVLPTKKLRCVNDPPKEQLLWRYLAKSLTQRIFRDFESLQWAWSKKEFQKGPLNENMYQRADLTKWVIGFWSYSRGKRSKHSLV